MDRRWMLAIVLGTGCSQLLGLDSPSLEPDASVQQPVDMDGDGVVDDMDNCPMTPNKDQTDVDDNQIGNACEGCTTLPLHDPLLPPRQDRAPAQRNQSTLMGAGPSDPEALASGRLQREPHRPGPLACSGSTTHKNADIGSEVHIGTGVDIQKGATIGDGACIGNGSVVGSDAQIGAGATIGQNGLRAEVLRRRTTRWRSSRSIRVAKGVVRLQEESAMDKANVVIPKGQEGFYERFHFAPAVKDGDRLFCSGVIGVGADGKASADPETQFTQAFETLSSVLKAAGAAFPDVVEMTTFHVGLQQNLGKFMKVKDRYLTEPYPAWTAIGVSELASPGGLVEIKVIARLRS